MDIDKGEVKNENIVKSLSGLGKVVYDVYGGEIDLDDQKLVTDYVADIATSIPHLKEKKNVDSNTLVYLTEIGIADMEDNTEYIKIFEDEDYYRLAKNCYMLESEEQEDMDPETVAEFLPEWLKNTLEQHQPGSQEQINQALTRQETCEAALNTGEIENPEIPEMYGRTLLEMHNSDQERFMPGEVEESFGFDYTGDMSQVLQGLQLNGLVERSGSKYRLKDDVDLEEVENLRQDYGKSIMQEQLERNREFRY